MIACLSFIEGVIQYPLIHLLSIFKFTNKNAYRKIIKLCQRVNSEK